MATVSTDVGSRLTESRPVKVLGFLLLAFILLVGLSFSANLLLNMPTTAVQTVDWSLYMVKSLVSSLLVTIHALGVSCLSSSLLPKAF